MGGEARLRLLVRKFMTACDRTKCLRQEKATTAATADRQDVVHIFVVFFAFVCQATIFDTPFVDRFDPVILV